MKAFCKKNKYGIFIFILSLNCAGIYVTARLSTPFADFFTTTIGAGIRAGIGAVSALAPISVGEILIYLAVIAILYILAAVIISIIRLCLGKTAKKLMKSVLIILSLFILAGDLFVLTYATAYNRTPLNEGLGIDDGEITPEEAKAALAVMVQEANRLAERVPFENSGASSCPYENKQLFRAVNYAFDSFASKSDFFAKKGFTGKEILSSKYMTYTHLSGIFTPFTGEANINTNYPDYIVAYTAAHEYAHARGLAPEDEANLTAFLVLYESEDDYLRYSALAYTIPKVVNAVYAFDPESCGEILSSLSDRLFGEWDAYNKFFEKYRDNAAADAADKVNDAYLKSQGETEGSASYGLFTNSIIHYLNDKNK